MHDTQERLAASMRRAVDEKLFFASRVPPDVTCFADFGCADGFLLGEVAKLRGFDLRGPEMVFLGYDHDPAMAHLAQTNGALSRPAFEFTSTTEMFAARIQRHQRAGHKVCLILSSVVHEVLSQGTSFRELWVYIASLGADYIAIRDMAVSWSCKMRSVPYPASLALPSEMTNGSFADCLQALIKSRYTDNPEREAREDYFAMTSEAFLNWTTIGTRYQLAYYDHAPLPFFVEEWRRRYGVEIAEPTHLKMILKRET